MIKLIHRRSIYHITHRVAFEELARRQKTFEILKSVEREVCNAAGRRYLARTRYGCGRLHAAF